MKYLSVLILLFVSVAVSAAGVSTTNFTGTSFSNTITNGSSSDSASYAGSAASSEFADGVFSTRNDRYAGSSNASESVLGKRLTVLASSAELSALTALLAVLLKR